MKKLTLLTAYLSLFSIFTSCESDDDTIIPNEEELITTVNYILTPAEGESITLSFQDLDGDGGEEPTINVDTLASNQTYTGSLLLLNESESPAENISDEVEEEDQEHQFFFASTTSGLTISYNDEDANGNPLGLSTTITTGEAGSGTVTVTLRHEPNKSASGVSDGDITNAGGETDIEVTYPIHVL